MQLFFQPNIEKKHFLSEEDSRHCVKVLRKIEKDLIHIVDGKGGLFECEILKNDAKKTEFKILNSTQNFGKKDFYLHIAIAPTKNSDRLEWFVEKAVEIGIDEISLIETQHSERRFQKIDRLEKIAIGAMKQSLKAYLPKINEMISLEKFLKNVSAEQKFIAHLLDGAKLLQTQLKPKSNVCILIGPEGDFSETEIKLSHSADFQVVMLGNSRLRTETAALVATTITNFLNCF